MADLIPLPAGYPALLEELKNRIHRAQLGAAFAVSRELLLLYWSIGRDILGRQQSKGRGTKVIDRLAKDLQTEFPGAIIVTAHRPSVKRWWSLAHCQSVVPDV